jgi:peptide/nickel transport system substrate-binding protein
LTGPVGSEGRRASGVRIGKRPKIADQTSINAPRQKNQAIVKQACGKAGIDIRMTPF